MHKEYILVCSELGFHRLGSLNANYGCDKLWYNTELKFDNQQAAGSFVTRLGSVRFFVADITHDAVLVERLIFPA